MFGAGDVFMNLLDPHGDPVGGSDGKRLDFSEQVLPLAESLHPGVFKPFPVGPDGQGAAQKLHVVSDPVLQIFQLGVDLGRMMAVKA